MLKCLVKSIRIITFLFFWILVKSAQAYEPHTGNITGTIGPIVYQTMIPHLPDEMNNPILGGFGLVANGDVNTTGSLEVGIFYAHQIYYRHIDDQYRQMEKIKRMHVSMGYRWWWNPYLSASLSFYSSYAIGDPQVYHSNMLATAAAVDTSAQDITEYGFDFAMQCDLWNNSKSAVILEARYSLNVTSKSNEDADRYGLMLGYRWLVQEGKLGKNEPVKSK